MQSAITGFMSVDDIGNLQDWLKNIRKASSKQFKAQWKKNKLQKYLNETSGLPKHGPGSNINGISNAYSLWEHLDRQASQEFRLYLQNKLEELQ